MKKCQQIIQIKTPSRSYSFMDHGKSRELLEKTIAELKRKKVPYRIELIRTSGRGRKYNNRRIQDAGMQFDSQLEYRRWKQLQILEQAGEICNLRRQVAFSWETTYSVGNRTYREPRKHSYVADFVYNDKTGKLIVEDTKGVITSVYRRKRRIMQKLFGITIKETFSSQVRK